MNDKVVWVRRLSKQPPPVGLRRVCDVCLLLEAEHRDPLGNDCYRRIVAARFPASAPARWTARRSPLEVQRATERGVVLQSAQEGLWKALMRAS